MILVGIIAAKSKPFVVHLNVLNYNNCPSIGRYLFLNPVRINDQDGMKMN